MEREQWEPGWMFITGGGVSSTDGKIWMDLECGHRIYGKAQIRRMDRVDPPDSGQCVECPACKEQ
jgi:hypothetical protein